MAEPSNDLFSSFMKKQISEKSSKKTLTVKSSKSTCETSNGEQSSDSSKEKNEDKNQEEMTEEEELEEAKKESRNKAAQYDQSDMIKKMIIENIVKYTAVISVLVIVSIGLVKFGPALLGLLNGLIYKILMSALGTH